MNCGLGRSYDGISLYHPFDDFCLGGIKRILDFFHLILRILIFEM